MQFYVIADEDTVVGFRYAGVEGVIVRGPEEAAAALDRLVKDRAEMIVIITEHIADAIRDRINAIRFSEELPLVVEIPGREGAVEAEAALLRTIRDAVGIKF